MPLSILHNAKLSFQIFFKRRKQCKSVGKVDKKNLILGLDPGERL